MVHHVHISKVYEYMLNTASTALQMPAQLVSTLSLTSIIMCIRLTLAPTLHDSM